MAKEKTFIIDVENKKVFIVLEDGSKHEMPDLACCADCPAIIGPCFCNCSRVC